MRKTVLRVCTVLLVVGILSTGIIVENANAEVVQGKSLMATTSSTKKKIVKKVKGYWMSYKGKKIMKITGKKYVVKKLTFNDVTGYKTKVIKNKKIKKFFTFDKNFYLQTACDVYFKNGGYDRFVIKNKNKLMKSDIWGFNKGTWIRITKKEFDNPNRLIREGV